jgi:hypothetical protein
MVGPHLLCNVCQVGRPVHLYRVTDTVQVLGCEDCARDSGLERDDIEAYGEDSESSTPRHRSTERPMDGTL